MKDTPATKAINFINEIGMTGCLFELHEHYNTVMRALRLLELAEFEV